MTRRLLAAIAVLLVPFLTLGAAPSSAAAAIVATTTTLSISPSTVTLGGAQTVRVTVRRADGTPYVGPFTLQWSQPLADYWENATVSTDSTGAFTRSFISETSRIWRAVTPRSTATAASTSGFVEATVALPLALTSVPSYTKVGNLLAVQGRTTAQDGLKANLWLYSGGTWSRQATVDVETDGRFTLYFRPKTIGARAFRVTLNSTVSSSHAMPGPRSFTHRTWTYFHFNNIDHTAPYWYLKDLVIAPSTTVHPGSVFARLSPTQDHWQTTLTLGGGCWVVDTVVGVESGSPSTSKFTAVAQRQVGGQNRVFAQSTRTVASSATWNLDVTYATTVTFLMQWQAGATTFRAALGTPTVRCWRTPPAS